LRRFWFYLLKTNDLFDKPVVRSNEDKPLSLLLRLNCGFKEGQRLEQYILLGISGLSGKIIDRNDHVVGMAEPPLNTIEDSLKESIIFYLIQNLGDRGLDYKVGIFR